jgi:hypothetical protein
MKEICHMKRTFMAFMAVMAFSVVVGVAGPANAAGSRQERASILAILATACPGYPNLITWNSYYSNGYFLSNDGWSISNGAHILTWKWLGQVNQCFHDVQLSDGNWAEELGNDNLQCMEDPGWKYNAGIDQYSCFYYYQLNEQWAEQNSPGGCEAGRFCWALENQGVNQYAFFNCQNCQALLRNWSFGNQREEWL